MAETEQQLTRKISPYKIIYPVIIGVGVVAYMLYREFDPAAFREITFTWHSVAWLLVAVLCMFIRDFGYIVRIRVLSGGRLSWWSAVRIIFLWEFTSAVTPSAVGGTSIAILFVNKEGIKVGRSSAMVMATSFLDELYFILMFPIILICVSQSRLWDMPGVVGHAGGEPRRDDGAALGGGDGVFPQADLLDYIELRAVPEPSGTEMAADEMFQAAHPAQMAAQRKRGGIGHHPQFV